MRIRKRRQPVGERFDEENPAGRWRIFDAFRPGSIRTRLLVAFIAVILLLAAVVSAGTVVVSFRSAQEQVMNQLESVATLKEAEIRIWLHSLQTNLVTTGLRGDAIRHACVLLQESRDSADYQDAYNSLIEYFRQIELAEQFDELFLMDRFGVGILSTEATQEYRMHGHQPYFQEEWKAEGKGVYVQPPSLSLAQLTLILAHPVVDPEGQTVGVLAGRVNLATFNQIMLERAGLGETGETYLVGADHILLSGLRFETREEEFGTYVRFVRTEGIDAALEAQTNGSGLYHNYRERPVVGVYHWLPELEVVVVAEQEQAEGVRPVYVMLRIIGGVAMAAVLAAVGTSVLVTRSITGPITQLVEVTDRISMGDLDAAVGVSSRDEIGDLAESIERMRVSLKTAIERLKRQR